EYAKAAIERGLKPITGCELTIRPAADGRRPAESHLTVLCASVEGYRNLCRLLSRAYQLYGKDEPLVGDAELLAHRDGLLVLSGCRRGEIAQLLEHGERALAEEVAARY